MGKSEQKALAVNRLSDRVIVIEGNYFAEHMTAVATGKGLVIIDTLTTAADTRRAWKLIKDFSSEPVRYVINTHLDLDHYAGNQVFSKAAIIAHQNGKSHFDEVMFADKKNIAEVTNLINYVKEQQQKKKPGSKEAEIWKRYLDEYQILYDGFDGFKFTPPNMYISGDIKLELGDMEIAVKYLGPGHTSADLLILIPGERIMIAGDLVLGKDFLPVIHQKHGGSVENLIRILKTLLKMKGDIDKIVPGHGKITDFSAVESQLNYLESLMQAVKDAHKKKLTLQEAKQQISLEQYKYHYLYDFVHVENIETAWTEYTKNK